MDEILKKIEQYADKAHGTQTRKYTPERYMVHPVRVMNICRPYSSELPVLAAALLHDVLEDTAVTENELGDYLREQMSRKDAGATLKLVIELTDVYVKKNYPRLNRRQRKAKEQERLSLISSAGQTIKYADIIDNSKEIVEMDPDFAQVFLSECRALLQKMDKGNTTLRQQAIDLVNDGIDTVRTYNKGI